MPPETSCKTPIYMYLFALYDITLYYFLLGHCNGMDNVIEP